MFYIQNRCAAGAGSYFNGSSQRRGFFSFPLWEAVAKRFFLVILREAKRSRRIHAACRKGMQVVSFDPLNPVVAPSLLKPRGFCDFAQNDEGKSSQGAFATASWGKGATPLNPQRPTTPTPFQTHHV
jgi:hypothetical protein